MAADRSTVHESDLDIVAGNGLLHRRMFLTAGTAAAAAVASSALPNLSAADALPVEPWMKVPGSGFSSATASPRNTKRRSPELGTPRPARPAQVPPARRSICSTA